MRKVSLQWQAILPANTNRPVESFHPRWNLPKFRMTSLRLANHLALHCFLRASSHYRNPRPWYQENIRR